MDYIRSTDGARMIEVKPNEFANVEALKRLGSMPVKPRTILAERIHQELARQLEKPNG